MSRQTVYYCPHFTKELVAMHSVTQEIRVESGRELRSPWSEHKISTLLRQIYSLTLPSFVIVILCQTVWGAWDVKTKKLIPLPQGVYV